MQSVLEMESGNVCRELSRLLLVPNWALKMVRISYLCYAYFSTIKKTSKVTSPQVLFQRKTCGFILHILMHHYVITCWLVFCLHKCITCTQFVFHVQWYLTMRDKAWKYPGPNWVGVLSLLLTCFLWSLKHWAAVLHCPFSNELFWTKFSKIYISFTPFPQFSTCFTYTILILLEDMCVCVCGAYGMQSVVLFSKDEFVCMNNLSFLSFESF